MENLNMIADCHCQSASLFHVFLFPKYPSNICNLPKGNYYLLFNNKKSKETIFLIFKGPLTYRIFQ